MCKCLKVSRNDRVELSQFTVFFYGGPQDHLPPGKPISWQPRQHLPPPPPPLNIYVPLSSNNKLTKLSCELTCKENNHLMCGWSLHEVVESGARLEGGSNMPNRFIFQNDIEAQYERHPPIGQLTLTLLEKKHI